MIKVFILILSLVFKFYIKIREFWKLVLLLLSSGGEDMKRFLLCWILDSYGNDYEGYSLL